MAGRREPEITPSEPYVPDMGPEDVEEVAATVSGSLVQVSGRRPTTAEVADRTPDPSFNAYVAQLEKIARKADLGELPSDEDLEYVQSRGMIEMLKRPNLRASHRLKLFDQIMGLRAKKLTQPRVVELEGKPTQPAGSSLMLPK